MTKTICLYHADCTDGAAAAAVVRYKFPETRCIPVKHGDPFTVDVTGARVFVVDFSFAPDIFKDIRQKAHEVCWYDHHKTALAIRDAVGFGVLDLNESGASLTWKQLFPDKPLPPILAYVRDKDIWQWKLPYSREINTRIADLDNTLDPTHSLWTSLLEKSDAELLPLREEGAIILRHERKRMIDSCKNAFPVNFHGHRAFALNWSDDASAIGEYIYQDLGYEIAILFKYDGKGWKVSLRSSKVDVSALAEKYGGGGHPGASGFKCNEIGWLNPV